MIFSKYIRFIEQGIFSIYNFFLVWLSFSILEIEDAAYFGILIAIYSFINTILNSFISTPLLFLNGKIEIPNIHAIPALVIIIAIGIILSDSDALLLLLIPLWCIRDLIRAFAVYLQDEISCIINLIVLSFCILVLGLITKSQENIITLIFIFSVVPTIINTLTNRRSKIKKVSLFFSIKSNISYGSKNTIEMLLSAVIWQAPTIILYQVGMTNLSLMLSKLMQVNNLSATLIRITTLMISKRYREGDFISKKHKVFLISGFLSASGSFMLSLFLYPADILTDRVGYYVLSGTIFFGYIFIFISKPYDWHYRTMQQNIYRIYHLIIFLGISVLISCGLAYFVNSMLAIAVYFSSNYYFQYWSFKRLTKGVPL